MATWWLLFAVFLGPLAALPPEWGVGLDQAKNAGFLLLGFVAAVWFLPNWWTRAFLGLVLVSFVASGMRAWGLAGVLGVLIWFVFFTHAIRLSRSAWPRIRLVMLAAAGLQLGWMAVQWMGHDPIFWGLSYRGDLVPGNPPITGWFGNASDMALFLGFSIPAALAVSPWLLVPFGAAILWLRSTAGFVCLALSGIGVAFHASLRLGLLALVAGLVLGAGFVRLLDSQGLGLRPVIWRQGIGLVSQRPWLGWGPNALDYRVIVTHPTPTDRWNFLFNEWIQGAVELGAGAPLLALGYLGSLARRLRRRWPAVEWETLAGMACLLSTSVFSIPLRIGPVALLGALYLGRLEGRLSETA